MGMRNGPDDLLHSLTELRPGEAKRRYRRSIFEDFPTKGPFGHCACAYCGAWNEKLTLDHIVPKSKGGPHCAKHNLVPSCFACNSSKSNLNVWEWWRVQSHWSESRAAVLNEWVRTHLEDEYADEPAATVTWARFAVA
jgi:5-methylcytosine-specific restriction endonuclease McrA